MRKPRRTGLIIIAAIAVAAIGVCVWFSLSHDKPIIEGKISDADLEAVTAIVRKEIRKDVLPNHSAASFKALPGALIESSRQHIHRIEAKDGYVFVTVRRSGKVGGKQITTIYGLENASGWEISDTQIIVY